MPNWSEVPWGTVITGVVAVYGAVLSTTNLIVQQRRDRLTAGEAQRRQAEQVTGWLVRDYDGPEVPDIIISGLVLQNGSSQPVYDLIASIVTVHGAGPRTRVGFGKRVTDDPRSPFTYLKLFTLLPPGQTKTRIQHPGSGMGLRCGVELVFQDVAGCYWLRQGNGILKQVSQHPVDLYDLPQPAQWDGEFP
jgi:hypothetical protein